MKKHVITGGACVGKTTLCDELARLGYPVVPEAARAVIKEQLPNGILPWTDNSEFQELILDRIYKNEQQYKGVHIFCDRGILDGIAYCIESSTPIPPRLAQIACAQRTSPRYDKIFLLDAVSEYTIDNERVETKEFNIRVHETLGNIYCAAGYNVIRVPAQPLAERVQFILNHTR